MPSLCLFVFDHINPNYLSQCIHKYYHMDEQFTHLWTCNISVSIHDSHFFVCAPRSDFNLNIYGFHFWLYIHICRNNVALISEPVSHIYMWDWFAIQWKIIGAYCRRCVSKLGNHWCRWRLVVACTPQAIIWTNLTYRQLHPIEHNSGPVCLGDRVGVK